ncbi:MAG: M1 family metallopeptidase [Microscillaceae bacterium]|nr:M1 family metallopeptidase [Microscillaceae bacterium]
MHYTIEADFDKIQVDLYQNMKLEKVLFKGNSLDFKREGNAIFITFPQTQKKGQTGAIQMYFSGEPRVAPNAPWDGGFSWKKDAQGNHFIGVSCEGDGASLWWPTKDHLSEEPDSMQISCAVPADLICVANGSLRKEEKLEDQYRKFIWFVSYPINSYNVTLNVARYTHFSDTYTSEDGAALELDYYVLPENLEKAKKQFAQVKPMLACYEKLFGKYPFWNDGFALVETPYLGMEHQSAVAYGNKYQNGYLGYDLSGSGYGNKFDYIIIHEAGHEYWGNSVSCKDHAELWIHEAFCTYTEALYVECMYGKEAGYSYVSGLKGQVSNQTPIVGPLGVNASGGGDMYFKGALMLHTLRNVLDNDVLWFEIIKGITTDFKLKNTDTPELTAYISQKAGKNLGYFFKQYLYFPQIPTLEYKIEKKDKAYSLSFRWEADVEEFAMPLKIKVGKEEITLNPTSQWQQIPLKQATFELKENTYYIYTELKN